MSKPKVLVLDEQRKKQFKKDMQQVFRRYGFGSGYWVCADNNPTNRIGTTIYMGHTNPLAEELRNFLIATQSIMIDEAGHKPL